MAAAPGAIPTVAIISAGEMGTQLGTILVAHGVPVLTSVEGRGQMTRARALRAGMTLVPMAELVRAEFLLCVVPSDQALPAAASLMRAGVLRPAGPLYVDCNPLGEGTLFALDAMLSQAGCDLVDACILRSPGRAGKAAGLRLCASGPRASALNRLAPYGIEVQLLAGTGSASGLRIGVSAVSKALVAVFASVIARAQERGVAGALRQELAISHGSLLEWVSWQSVRLPVQSVRWSHELLEVAGDLSEPAGKRLFVAMADYLATLSESPADCAVVRAALDEFFGRPQTPQS